MSGIRRPDKRAANDCKHVIVVSNCQRAKRTASTRAKDQCICIKACLACAAMSDCEGIGNIIHQIHITAGNKSGRTVDYAGCKATYGERTSCSAIKWLQNNISCCPSSNSQRPIINRLEASVAFDVKTCACPAGCCCCAHRGRRSKASCNSTYRKFCRGCCAWSKRANEQINGWVKRVERSLL